MSKGRNTRREARRKSAEFWAVRYRFQQQQINQNLLKIPDVCYFVPSLRRVVDEQ